MVLVTIIEPPHFYDSASFEFYNGRGYEMF